MRFSSDALKTWPVVGTTLALVVLLALGLAYWSSIQDRERYLQSRNFRLLDGLASQTEFVISNRASIFRSALATTERSRLDAVLPSQESGEPRDAMAVWVEGAAASVPDGFDPVFEDPPAPSSQRPRTPVEARKLLSRYRLGVTAEGTALRLAWVPPNPKAQPTVSIRMSGQALRPIFEPKLDQGAFDTLVLATPDGVVVYAAGSRAAEISALRLGSIVTVPAGAERPDFRSIASRISEQPVQLAGMDYRMFVQPCCRTEGAAARADAPVTGLVVLGLADAKAMKAASLSISPVLVLIGVLFVLGALVGWSFLKMAFIGAHQRVRPVDVLQLTASSVFGLALATIALLTIAAYARLSTDVDRQLLHLATRLDDSFAEELTAAYKQLSTMTDHLHDLPCLQPVLKGERIDPDLCQDETAGLEEEFRSGPFYPDFITFAMMDPSGVQRVKVAYEEATRRRISVAERVYFEQAKSGQGLWALPQQCPEGCVLESIWSRTTGRSQGVISRQTGIEALPVAALSIRMASLANPGLPAGFEFAVIDGAGIVQFHSDKQRIQFEHLLTETDQNPHLQSLIKASSAGTVNVSYWGRPYRAYVKPATIPGWFVVALLDKQHLRGLVLEWSTMALMMQVAFTALLIVGMLVALRIGVQWLWPDPLRRAWYPWLTGFYGGGLLLWFVIAMASDVVTTVWAGVLLPLILWLVTFAVLARRLPGVPGIERRSDLHAEYRRAGTWLLTVTAVVPAASFFAVSYDAHVEGYVKSRQIALARSLDTSALCTAGPTMAFATDVRYDNLFYGTTVTCAPAPASAATDEQPRRRNGLGHWLLEDYLPFLTSASVEMRELLHERAGGEAWVSSRPSAGELELKLSAQDRRYQLTVQSNLPSILAARATSGEPQPLQGEEGGTPPWLTTLLIAVGVVVLVGAAASWVIGYLLRNVLLADVTEPSRGDEHLVTTVGQNLLVICDDPRGMAAKLSDVLVLEITPLATAPDIAKAWRKARVIMGEAGPTRPVVIPDLEDQLDDLSLTARKLGFIEELIADPDQTVVLLTRLPAPALAASVRDAVVEREPSRSGLFNRVSVVDARTSTQSADGEPVVTAPGSGWWSRLQWVVSSWFTRGPDVDERMALVAAEGRPNATLRRICDELRRSTAFQSGWLTSEEILEEIEERAAPLYRREWQVCNGDERVVLEHVASYGLVSAPSRRAVRRLLTRRLLRKDPHLRLMNESFRRFVMGLERRSEVAVLEAQAGPSVWDRMRTPLGVAAVAALAFLVTTQREAFDLTLTMAAGVTTAVPTLVKLTSLLTQLGGRSGGEPKANA